MCDRSLHHVDVDAVSFLSRKSDELMNLGMILVSIALRRRNMMPYIAGYVSRRRQALGTSNAVYIKNNAGDLWKWGWGAIKDEDSYG